MKQVMIRIPKELVDRIEKQAEKESRSRSNMIRVLIEQAMEDKK
jgi:metal-responsive CopG/Arc/MetJ family transcriptional regulator